MVESFYAHTREGSSSLSNGQLLENHLIYVADLASRFTSVFDSVEWGYLAGLWHDLGKYQAAFQKKLEGAQISVEHSGLGAAYAVSKDKTKGIPLAFVIAGHHGGMANPAASEPGQPTPLMERLKSNQTKLDSVLHVLPESITRKALPYLPPFLMPSEPSNSKEKTIIRRRSEFWIRFLFSALIDADRLDTECFAEDPNHRLRGGYSSIDELKRKLDGFLKTKSSSLSDDASRLPINRARAGVLESCWRAAKEKPGGFSLTVPTGGGKTLSAMAFALAHAEQHAMRRVIVVIPYTSIIEQNAEQYRLALGAENVVEHHSNLDFDRYREQYGEEETRRVQLASENWDAPVIVTTTVQFFESLFSNRPSRCRKLHNIAKSVIILDEVQSLPPEYLLSILDGLKELISHYGCSVVLSTATPPALKERERFECGLTNVTEIVPCPVELSNKLKRVDYVWPEADSPPVSWEDLAEELVAHSQVLAIVHRRDDARELAEELARRSEEDEVFHLSALMCPAHRSDVLAHIRERLQAKEACRLVSTQLVEAGVDIDFPAVYRALGGLDSMVQAAGRCNREGRNASGRVVIFRAPSKPPKGTPQKALEIVEAMLRKEEGGPNVSTPEVFVEYFRQLYLGADLDARRIQSMRQELRFADVAQEFRLIEDGFVQSIIVPYGQGKLRLEELRNNGPSRHTLRSLQPYIVNVYPKAFQDLRSSGALDEVADGLFALSPVFAHVYSMEYGLTAGEGVRPDPGELIV